jgi:hypothetical protein
MIDPDHSTGLMKMVSIHESYGNKIKEIGRRLGYDSRDQSTPIGRVDAKWSEAKLSPFLEKKEIPVAVFEVVCSEGQKDNSTDFLERV